MGRGKLITFEGCEGAGKSAQIRLLSEYFNKNGIEFVCTREPGGTEIAERIRNLILDMANVGMSGECEALLYAAARCEHIQNFLLPNLNFGKIVICDRYIDSSFAYQGYARELGFDFVKKINETVFKACLPDLTVFLSIAPDAAFDRKGGADGTDRLETEGLAFHKKVYEGYKLAAAEYPERIVTLDVSEGTKYENHDRIVALLKSRGIIG